MYYQDYVKENKIEDKSEDEKNLELIVNIIKTKNELDSAHKNFEFADSDLVDYYIYEIKAHQAKLNYLIKVAKTKGINVDFIKDIEYRTWDEEVG